MSQSARGAGVVADSAEERKKAKYAGHYSPFHPIGSGNHQGF